MLHAGVHIYPTLEMNRRHGIDIQTWIDSGLCDWYGAMQSFRICGLFRLSLLQNADFSKTSSGQQWKTTAAFCCCRGKCKRTG